MSGAVAMVAVKLRYVVSDVDRYGHARHYLRRPGQRKVRLPGAPGSLEFMAAYHDAMGTEPPPPATRAGAGSFGALCIAYYSSPTFHALDASTQSWRRRALDRIRETDGHNPVALMDAQAIIELVEELAATPGAALNRYKALKALFKWGLNHRRADANPTLGVAAPQLRSEGFHTWTDAEVEQYRAHHALGTKARLAMELLLNSAGRREDAVRLGPQHARGWRLRFRQAKNEHRSPVDIDVPLLTALAEAIEAMGPARHLTFLMTDYGKPFSPAGFGNRFREWCDAAGLPQCSAHGLRKAAATRLAEAGATAHEIMSVTGHRTLEEVERYTRKARMAKLADSALAKLDKGEG